MPTTLTSNYAWPGVLLNPVVLLHIVNTVISYIIPSNLPPARSPHPWIELLGPVSGSEPYFDIHADDRLCWRYTAVMIAVQVVVYGRISHNRIRNKAAAKAKQKALKERAMGGAVRIKTKLDGEGDEGKDAAETGSRQSLQMMDGTADIYINGHTNGHANGSLKGPARRGANGKAEDETCFLKVPENGRIRSNSSESTTTEASEEETIV